MLMSLNIVEGVALVGLAVAVLLLNL